MKHTVSFLILFASSILFSCSQGRQGSVESNPSSALGETSAILGGEAVSAEDVIAQSTVGILHRRSGQVICTGSLIASNIVVTAGHCTFENPQELAILFSQKVPQNSKELAEAEVRNVLTGRAHPNWSKLQAGQKTNWGDIALLRFVGQVPAGFQPARILSELSVLKNGSSAILAGFGYVNGRTREEATELRKTSVVFKDVAYSETEVLFDQSRGQGACHGDSGGPAFVQVGKSLLLFGVTSRGTEKDVNDTCEVESVYTTITSLLPWIRSTVTSLRAAKRAERIPQPL